MAIRNYLRLNLTPQQKEQIEDLAQRRGYKTPGEYLLALVGWDAEVINEEDVDLEANFRQSWHEAMTGQVYPIETLWDDLRDE